MNILVGILSITLLLFQFETLASASEEKPHTKVQDELESPDAKIYPQGLISLSTNGAFSRFAFVVDKSARTLTVYESLGDKLTQVAQYPTDIGKNDGEKTKRNDYKTPVGIYFLQEKKTQPEIPFNQYGSIAFTTDYPNIFDNREGKSGSGIWLHAIPDTVALTRGSRGCVVVRDNVIKELQNFVKLGQTPLLIFDKVTYLNEEEYKAQRKRYLDHFEKWRTTWEQSDVDNYIQFYDASFQNDEMNYKQWYRHKKKIKDLYKYIHVRLLPPTILQNKDQVVIRTAQRYESDLHRDFGEKTIHARFSDNVGFKIIREDWHELDAQYANEFDKLAGQATNLTDKKN
jgi:murein L,D-transpeptidase YafK